MQKERMSACIGLMVCIGLFILAISGCEDPAGINMTNGDAASLRDAIFITDMNVEGGTTTDEDHDGYPAGMDCNDHNSAIHPAAAEVCDELGVDEDCNPCTVSGIRAQEGGLTNDGDEDNNGLIYAGCVNRVPLQQGDAGTAPTCPGRQVFRVGGAIFIAGTDCSDRRLSNPAQRPGALCTTTCGSGTGVYWTLRYIDGDNDGQGGVQVRLVQCGSLQGTSERTGDCNDADGSVNSTAAEQCNFRDDNCDGIIDNLGGGSETCLCGACATSCDMQLGVGIATGRRDTCGSSSTTCQPPPEVCSNSRDDNCDGRIDEGCCVNGMPCLERSCFVCGRRGTRPCDSTCVHRQVCTTGPLPTSEALLPLGHPQMRPAGRSFGGTVTTMQGVHLGNCNWSGLSYCSQADALIGYGPGISLGSGNYELHFRGSATAQNGRAPGCSGDMRGGHISLRVYIESASSMVQQLSVTPNEIYFDDLGRASASFSVPSTRECGRVFVEVSAHAHAGCEYCCDHWIAVQTMQIVGPDSYFFYTE